jgi:hypothetical protein
MLGSLPSVLLAQMIPLCFSINSLQRSKPKPVPCSFSVPGVVKLPSGWKNSPPARLGEFYGIGNQVSQNRELPILEFQLNQSRLKVIDEFRCIGIRFDSLVHFFIFTTVASADLHFSRKIAGFKRLTINNLMNY